jgi:hypothetical protein
MQPARGNCEAAPGREGALRASERRPRARDLGPPDGRPARPLACRATFPPAAPPCRTTALRPFSPASAWPRRCSPSAPIRRCPLRASRRLPRSTNSSRTATPTARASTGAGRRQRSRKVMPPWRSQAITLTPPATEARVGSRTSEAETLVVPRIRRRDVSCLPPLVHRVVDRDCDRDRRHQQQQPTNSIARRSPPGSMGSASRSISPTTVATTATIRASPATSAWRASRSTRSPTCASCSPASRSTRCRCR